MNWKGYIGIEGGKLQLCISQSPLNLVGNRLEKGRLLPEAVYALAQTEKPTPEQAAVALDAFQDWLDSDPHYNKPKKKR